MVAKFLKISIATRIDRDSASALNPSLRKKRPCFCGACPTCDEQQAETEELKRRFNARFSCALRACGEEIPALLRGAET